MRPGTAMIPMTVLDQPKISPRRTSRRSGTAMPPPTRRHWSGRKRFDLAAIKSTGLPMMSCNDFNRFSFNSLLARGSSCMSTRSSSVNSTSRTPGCWRSTLPSLRRSTPFRVAVADAFTPDNSLYSTSGACPRERSTEETSARWPCSKFTLKRTVPDVAET